MANNDPILPAAAPFMQSELERAKAEEQDEGYGRMVEFFMPSWAKELMANPTPIIDFLLNNKEESDGDYPS